MRRLLLVRIVVALLLSAWVMFGRQDKDVILAQTQLQGAIRLSIPEHIIYEQLFRTIADINQKAVAEKASGQSAGRFQSLRQAYKLMLDLTDAEDKMLDQIASDCADETGKIDRQAMGIIQAYWAKYPPGSSFTKKNPPHRPKELTELQDKKDRTVLEHKDRLRMQLGEKRFEKFEAMFRLNRGQMIVIATGTSDSKKDRSPLQSGERQFEKFEASPDRSYGQTIATVQGTSDNPYKGTILSDIAARDNSPEERAKRERKHVEIHEIAKNAAREVREGEKNWAIEKSTGGSSAPNKNNESITYVNNVWKNDDDTVTVHHVMHDSMEETQQTFQGYTLARGSDPDKLERLAGIGDQAILLEFPGNSQLIFRRGLYFVSVVVQTNDANKSTAIAKRFAKYYDQAIAEKK